MLAAVVVSACQCGPAAGGGTSGGSSTGTGGGTGGASGNGGSGGAGGSGPTVTGLAFEPPELTLTLDGTGAAQLASFQLFEVLSNGTRLATVASQVFFDRPDLATAMTGSPVVLTAATRFAGTGTLTSALGQHSATAKLHIKQQAREVGAMVPPNVVTALTAPNLPQDPALAALLYPYDHTVFPLGLAAPLVMWNAPAAGDTYLLRLERANYRFELVFAGAQPGRVRAPQARWDEATTAGAATDPLVVTLLRYDAATSTAYTSTRQEWRLSGKSLRGAIYYWTTSGSGHLARIRPGSGAMPETIGGGQCMGCHAVSADGTRLVASVEANTSNDQPGSSNRGWVTYDLPAATERKASTLFGGNLAINPNGKYVVYGTVPLRIADAVTGTRITTSDLETLPLDMGMATYAHPVFSPDGKRFAAVQSSAGWYEWGESRLMLAAFDEANVKFTGATELTSSMMFPTGTKSIAYPSFSPDSQWLAFHVGDHASGCAVTCDVNETGVASLYLQSVAGGASVPLTKLNDSSLLMADRGVSFEPTFNPIESGGYFWVVFTSTRDFGNLMTGAPKNGKKRLWVAAVDKTGATGGDPSHPAFYLEGQEDTMNMRGYWTLAACTATGPTSTCAAGFECCSGFCSAGRCIDPGPVACKQVNEACTSTSECCNAGAIVCDQVCKSAIN